MNRENLEININKPSSPLVPLQIHNFVKEINIPVEMKIQTNNNNNMTGGGTTTDNGIFGYFKSFFQGFSQQTLQKKKHDTQNKSYLNSLFYSGNEEKQKESESIPTEEEKSESIPTEEQKESESIPTEEQKESESIPTEEQKSESIPTEEQNENTEITKIILTTEDPETILRESLKGTKLYYLTERNDLPSQWV
jgi:hypothetical protein